MLRLPQSSAVPLTLLLLAPALLGLTGDARAPDLPLPVVKANDNRSPAGSLRGKVLKIRLVVGMAKWYPQSGNGPSVDVETFAEEGRAPMIPAPLIRVPTGTMIEATIRNALADSTVTLFGFHARPNPPDSIRLAPGEVRTVRFAAGEPGTYLYRGVVWKYRDRVGAPTPETHEREQLAGAFIVDSAGPRPDDRVFVINIWGDWKDSTDYRNALAINGLSWPHTERIGTRVGDTLRWRVVNPSARTHPMHLHGFYFSVDSHGHIGRDTVYTPSQRRTVATEVLRPGQTIAMTWSPDRPGNWLFHCHLGFHVVPEARLDAPPHRHASNYAHDPGQHMAGLILGVVVEPGRGWKPAPERTTARPLRLMVQEGWKRARSPRSMSFVLQRDNSAPVRDSIEMPSSTLVLTRGEPTDITVVNQLAEATGVHWHGIELESYSDGVPGWSGMGKRVAPLIAPRDSFTARLTLPRAGTFIYHTHLNDLEQLTSGLYGAIVVLEPGKMFDSRTDHIFLIGWDGTEQPPRLVVNGDSLPRPVEMAFGSIHRLRLINIGVGGFVRFALMRDTTSVTWRAVAKDGADLPSSQATTRRAVQSIMVGETYDFEFQPPERGTYTLTIDGPGGPQGSKRRQRITVR